MAVKALSFLGGMIVVSGAAAALILSCPKVRDELEHQSLQLLDATQGIINQGQAAVYKLQSVSSSFGLNVPGSTNNMSGNKAKAQTYEKQWSDVIQ
jgi:hypothetical protein